MDYGLILATILKNPAFWAALISLGNAIVLYFIPTFPKEILVPLDTLIGIIASAFAGVQIVTTVRVRLAQRAAAMQAQTKPGQAPGYPTR